MTKKILIILAVIISALAFFLAFKIVPNKTNANPCGNPPYIGTPCKAYDASLTPTNTPTETPYQFCLNKQKAFPQEGITCGDLATPTPSLTPAPSNIPLGITITPLPTLTPTQSQQFYQCTCQGEVCKKVQ